MENNVAAEDLLEPGTPVTFRSYRYLAEEGSGIECGGRKFQFNKKGIYIIRLPYTPQTVVKITYAGGAEVSMSVYEFGDSAVPLNRKERREMKMRKI